MPDREKVIKGLGCCREWGMTEADCCKSGCPYERDELGCLAKLHTDALELIEDRGWAGTDKRPPHEGYYLVYGVTNFVPDHVDLPNGYWEIKIGYWTKNYGWMTVKVKYWRELPDPPET